MEILMPLFFQAVPLLPLVSMMKWKFSILCFRDKSLFRRPVAEELWIINKRDLSDVLLKDRVPGKKRVFGRIKIRLLIL